MSNSEQRVNASPNGYVGWTFRKAQNFFDVVTYTGNGVNGRTVNHNLGAVPGMIIVKCTTTTGNWVVWHRGASGTLWLNSNNRDSGSGGGQATGGIIYNPGATNTTSFTVDGGNNVNTNNTEYVAYIFAHHDGTGTFGPEGNQDIIQCGSYTGSGTTDKVVDLGFEPDFLMIKPVSINGFWSMYDQTRGITSGKGVRGTRFLQANTSTTSYDYYGDYYGDNALVLTSDGFILPGDQSVVNGNLQNYIYLAVRRGPLSPPETSSEVFAMDTGDSSGSGTANYNGYGVPEFEAGFPVDWGVWRRKNAVQSWNTALRSNPHNLFKIDTVDGVSNYSAHHLDNTFGFYYASENNDYQGWMWRRAPHFFTTVSYIGTGSSRAINHNLGVTPEMMIVKRTSGNGQWAVYHHESDSTAPQDYVFQGFNTTAAKLNDNAFWNDTAPTATQFTVGGNYQVNDNTETFTALLFATVDGVSKVGSYTGSSSPVTVDCGFTNGAKFVLLKRSNGTGAWIVMDTERGINAGTESYMLWGRTNAEITNQDIIDYHSSGFIINNAGGGVNESGGEYVFYAIAA
jgi:hypothetical protein